MKPIRRLLYLAFPRYGRKCDMRLSWYARLAVNGCTFAAAAMGSLHVSCVYGFDSSIKPDNFLCYTGVFQSELSFTAIQTPWYYYSHFLCTKFCILVWFCGYMWLHGRYMKDSNKISNLKKKEARNTVIVLRNAMCTGTVKLNGMFCFSYEKCLQSMASGWCSGHGSANLSCSAWMPGGAAIFQANLLVCICHDSIYFLRARHSFQAHHTCMTKTRYLLEPDWVVCGATQSSAGH